MSYDRSWDNFEKLSPVKKKSRGRIYYVPEIFSELLMKIYMPYLKKNKIYTIFGDQSHVSSVVCVTDDYSVLLWNHLKNFKSFAEKTKK